MFPSHDLVVILFDLAPVKQTDFSEIKKEKSKSFRPGRGNGPSFAAEHLTYDIVHLHFLHNPE